MAGKTCIALLVCLTASAALNAAEEFGDSIPTELAEIFLGIGPDLEGGLYRDIPEGLPDFTLPDGFTVLGGIDRQIQLQAVLESDLDPDEAKQALLDALEAQDWIILPGRELPGQQAGFVSAQPINLPSQACREDYGSLQIHTRQHGGRTLATLTGTDPTRIPGMNRLSCEQGRDNPRGFFAAGNPMEAISQQMPRLEMPEAMENRSISPLMGRISGSPDDAESSADLVIGWDLGRVYRHFAEQIEDQGWQLDEDWRGDLSAGGTWTRETEQGRPLLGMLILVKESDETYELNFRLRALDGERGANDGVVGVRPLFR